jgi:hypothetical protein
MMRKSLAIVALLMAVGASAGTITNLSPSTINSNSGEYFLTISGTGLGDQVLFNGPAGSFTLDINAQPTGKVVTWVPMNVVLKSGTYSVSVLGGTGNTAPVNFTVVNPNRFRWPLVLSLPDSLVLVAQGRSAKVFYTVAATDGEDSSVPVKCEPASGSTLGIGATRVDCTASNADGESARGSFNVFVHDATVPTLRLPARMTVKADAKEGSFVKYEVSASDEVDGIVPADCDVKSGGLFPVGVTTLGCWASDSSFNTARGSFSIDVVDKDSRMELVVPESIFAEAESKEGAVVKYDVYATGTLDTNPTISCDPKSESLFPIGTKTVRCRATDSFGATAEGSFDVTVADTVGPLMDDVTATPSVVEASGGYVGVKVSLKAIDLVDPRPQCTIAWVYGSEPLDSRDWSLSDALELKLHAITSGSEARVYHVVIGCQDETHNASFGEALVTVRK